jgi:GH24 family phage-related lysozyme (muramidase)
MARQLNTYASMSMAEAKELLNRDLDKYASGVSRLCKVPLYDYQFGALVSFAFNVGLGNLKASTLLRMINRGDSNDDVSEQFLRWNKAGGIVLRGLTIRREAERQMFLGNYGN